MNTLGISLLWLAGQVTLLCSVSTVIYLIARRRHPGAGATAALSGLLLTILLTLGLFSPWPRWSLHAVGPAPAGRATVDVLTLTPRPAGAGPTETGPIHLASDATSKPAIAPESASTVAWNAFWRSLRKELTNPTRLAVDSGYRWTGWLAWAVVLAIAFGALRLLAGWWTVHRCLRRCTIIDDRSLRELLDMLRAELSCRRNVELRQSREIASAATVGWRKPLVLLPPDWRDWSDSERRAVLAHELAHVASGDAATWLAAQVGLLLHFYHPLMHWLTHRLRLEQELAADAIAARLTGSSQTYLTTLAELAVRQPHLRVAWPARAFLPTHGTLLRRIEMLRDTKSPLQCTSTARRGIVIALTFVAAVLIAGLRPEDARVVAADESSVTQDSTNGESKNKPTDQADIEKQKKRAQEAIQQVTPVDLAGLVIDESGKPLAGVSVDAWHWFSGNETTTDEVGFFQLNNPGEDGHTKVELLFAKEGFAPVYVLQQPTGRTDFVVRLSSKPYFEGIVTDAKGQPVANAEIWATFGPVDIDGGVMEKVITSTKSAADGRYMLRVAPNIYDIQVSAVGSGVWQQSGNIISADETKLLPIRLEDGVRFEARVIDNQTKQPVEGFVLFQSQTPHLMGRSDAEGVITFENLNPGEIEFFCGGGEEKSLGPGMVYYEHGPFGRWWSPQATNEWDRYHLDKPEISWQRNFDSLSFDLRLGMEPVDIVVEQGVTVSGLVTDPEGKPVEKATVAPALTGTGNSLTGDTRYSVQTDAAGKYSVVLPASNDATYNLIVHDGGYDEWRNWANGIGPPMKTSPGQSIENFNLALTRPAVVRGRVTKDGQSVVDKQVRTHAFGKTENRYYDPTVRTLDDGTFELKFVRPGKHYLQVEPFWLPAEQAPGGSIVIEVAAGETLEGVELVAPEAGQ